MDSFFTRLSYQELVDKVMDERNELQSMGFVPTQISLTHEDYLDVLAGANADSLTYLLSDPPIMQWMGLKIIDCLSHKTYLS